MQPNLRLIRCAGRRGLRAIPPAAVVLCLAAAAAAGDLPTLVLPPKSPSGVETLPPASAEADAETYARCMALARSDPHAAQSLAEAWRKRGGAHPADHCAAVALIALGKYKQAAMRLQALAQAMTKAPAGLRAGVFDQAGQAWLLSGDPVRAYAAAGRAAALAPGDLEILIDHAEAAAAAGYLDRAVADLDHVLHQDPNRVDALIYRAAAYRALDRLDPARVDIDKALAAAPQSPAALLERGNLRRLEGDRDGARRDWEEVGRVAPGSPEDMAARANLEKLAKTPAAAASGPPAPVKPAESGAAMIAGSRRGPHRRRFLAGGLAAIAGGFAAPIARAEETEALRRLAAAKGLIYGTTIAAWQIAHDPSFTGLVEQQAGLVVPENDMKWQDINLGAPGDDDYSRADAIAGFAVESGMALRGHNLLWYFRTPLWFFALPSRTAKERAVIDHITALAGRYRDIVHSWDVVNEPIEPKDGRPDGLRKAVFLDALGPGYLDLAYRLTRETDPKARLVVNEYDIELDTPEHEARRNVLLALLNRMQKAGTPVDAVGIQAHLDAVGGPPFSPDRLRRFLADIAALGLSIQITELDVTDEKAPADIAARDRLVADAYRRFLDAALDEKAVEMVVTWGLSDRHSWIVRRETNEVKWRADELPSRPLPFDAELRPKPAFAAIAEALAHAPARTPRPAPG